MIKSDGTVPRVWKLLGAQGEQPFENAVPSIGDLDQGGKAEIAVTYPTVEGGGTSGYLARGVVTVLATGYAHNAEESDWPSLFQNGRDTGFRPKRTTPWAKITSPVPGAVLSGAVSAWTGTSSPGRYQRRWVL